MKTMLNSHEKHDSQAKKFLVGFGRHGDVGKPDKIPRKAVFDGNSLRRVHNLEGETGIAASEKKFVQAVKLNASRQRKYRAVVKLLARHVLE